jgi:putative transcriptional regulator
MSPTRKRRAAAGTGYLDGQLLLAMPGMADPRFARAVIYLCAHSRDGAMGIVINKRARKITFPDLLRQLDLAPEGDRAPASSRVNAMRVMKGGPVGAQNGFVLHSADYNSADNTLAVDDDVSLTATVEVLKAIVEGEGPSRAILALGYAGWEAGQLESEIQANGWLTCPADPDLVFDEDIDGKYARALGKLGIDPAMLVGEAGHG